MSAARNARSIRCVVSLLEKFSSRVVLTMTTPQSAKSSPEEQKELAALRSAIHQATEYLHRFAYALQLFEGCHPAAATAKLAGKRNRAEMVAVVEEIDRLVAWRQMAKRDAVVSLVHLRRAINKLVGPIEAAKLIQPRIDIAKIHQANALIDAHFPNVKLLKNIFSHEPDYTDARNSWSGDFEGGGVSIGAEAGENNIVEATGDTEFMATIYNERTKRTIVVKVDLSEKTLRVLAAATDLAYSAFSELKIDPPPRQPERLTTALQRA